MTLAALHAAPRVTARRDAAWLCDELERIWCGHFVDTPRVNRVDIAFGRPWMRRLGVIRMSVDGTATDIRINALLGHPDAPSCVARITIAHELVHYAHGFGSPLPRKHPYPHRGGVVNRELLNRGLGRDLADYDRWIHGHWWSFYARCAPRSRSLARR